MSDLRALAEKATPGPWQADLDVMAAEAPFYFSVLVVAGRPNTSMLFTQESSQRAVDTQEYRDAAYIAAASPDVILGLLDAIEDHSPDIGSWIDDSTWLTCSCGYDQSDPKEKRGWAEHILAALKGAS